MPTSRHGGVRAPAASWPARQLCSAPPSWRARLRCASTSGVVFLEEAADVEPAERDGQCEDEERHGRALAVVETRHTLLVDVGAQQVVVARLGSGILQHGDLREDPEVPDEVEEQ